MGLLSRTATDVVVLARQAETARRYVGEMRREARRVGDEVARHEPHGVDRRGVLLGDVPEQVHAIVLPKEGHNLTEEEVIAHCRKLIAGYKCPRSVEITREPLPMSGVGKILKRQLRERYVRKGG